MSARDYLVRRRGGMYAVRVRVPEALRARVGKREIWKSLGTSDFTEAKRKKLLVLEHIMAGLDDLKQEVQATVTDFEQIARDHYEAELRTDAHARRTWVIEGQTVPDHNALFLDEYLKESRKHLGAGQRVLVADAAEHHLKERGFKFEEKSASFAHLCQLLTRAEIEVTERKLERDNGDFSGRPADQFLVEALFNHPRGGGKEGKMPLSALLTRMHAEKTNIAQGTRDEHVSIVEAFEDYLGHKKPIAAITKQDVLGFKQLLICTPKNRTKLFPGCTLAESVRKNDARDEPYPVLHSKTIGGKYLGHLKAVLNWAVGDGIVETNVAEKVRIAPGKRSKKTRHPFHTEDVARIFSSPIFAGRGERNARFWAILIAAFNGLRAGEIGQLEPDDVVLQNGVWCFRVTEWSSSGEAREKKRLKTGESGRRYVPIHPELVAIGLTDHAERARKAKHSRLFPDWEPNARGDYSQGVPRWFNRTFLRSVGLDRPGLVFHSWRHSFKDAARTAGIPQEIHDFLTGHAAAGVSGGYGEGAGVAGLRKAIARIHLPIDLSRLHAT